MGWRDIRGLTYSKVNRIDRQTSRSIASQDRLLSTVGQAVSLYDKWSTGRKETEELQKYGESKGLTWSKKDKAFYGTTFEKKGDAEEYYKVSSADLKNIRNFEKYTEDDFMSIIKKDDKIKSTYATDLSKIDEKTASKFRTSAGDIRAGESMDVTMQRHADSLSNLTETDPSKAIANQIKQNEYLFPTYDKEMSAAGPNIMSDREVPIFKADEEQLRSFKAIQELTSRSRYGEKGLSGLGTVVSPRSIIRKGNY